MAVKVSIVMPTYGHEKYIEHAIQSVLMQKVNFEYELLIGEDCSPDNTKLIVQRYEKMYPDIIKAFYRNPNTYTHPEVYEYGNSADLKLKALGDFIITLEGDDFWINPDKLQKQVEFLERNPEYIAVAHRCNVVDEDEKTLNEIYPDCEDDEYTMRHFASEIMAGQTATILYRNIYRENSHDLWFLLNDYGPGDRRLLLYLLAKGKIACFQEFWSSYRHVTSGGHSYSANYAMDPRKIYILYEALLNFVYSEGSNDEIVKYTEMIYYRWILRMYRKARIDKETFTQWGKKIVNSRRARLLYLKQYINRRILKKKVFA